MSSLLEEFGHLIHIYSERNIKLTTTCTAKLSFPKEHACNVQKNESLAIQNSWIARGHGFRISFKINPNDVPVNNNDWSAIVEGLGIVLRDAKIWLDLGLQASLEIPDITSSEFSNENFVLSLKYLLPDGLPFVDNDYNSIYDTRPPDGVLVFLMEEMKITFTFSNTQGTRHISKRRRQNSQCSQGVEDKDMLLEIGSIQQNGRTYHHSQPTPYRLSEERSAKSAKYQAFSQPTSFVDEQRSQSGWRPANLPLKVSESDFCFSDASPDGFVSKEIGTKRSNEDKSPIHEQLDFTDFVKLVDAGLRTMICDDRVRISSGVKISKTSAAPKLAEFAPVLFCPGFLAAVSQRSRLYPTIARALPPLYRRAKSQILKAKIERLMNVKQTELLHLGLPKTEGCHITMRSMLAVIKARIWMLTQRTLFNRSAARRPKPLDLTDRAYSQSIESQNMLDDRSVCDLQEESELFTVRENKDIFLEDGSLLDGEDALDDELLFEDDRLMMKYDMSEDEFLLDEPQVLVERTGRDDDLLFSSDGLDGDNDILFRKEDHADTEDFLIECFQLARSRIVTDVDRSRLREFLEWTQPSW